jgi:hypothetical protein
MTDERLKKEYLALETLPKATFKFMGFNTDKPNLVVAQQTNSGKVYTIKIDLSNNFPYNIPEAFIVNPKPLLTYSRESMLGASHPMHTLSGKDGCVQVCHYGLPDWHANVLLFKIVIKIRVWLEAYEHHLKTGEPLSKYLSG